MVPTVPTPLVACYLRCAAAQLCGILSVGYAPESEVYSSQGYKNCCLVQHKGPELKFTPKILRASLCCNVSIIIMCNHRYPRLRASKPRIDVSQASDAGLDKSRLIVDKLNAEILNQRFRFCSLASKSLRVVSPPPAPSLSSPFEALLEIPLLFPPSPIGTLSSPAETAVVLAFANPTMGASGISSFIWIPISSSTCATIFSSSSSAPSSMTSSIASPIIS